jgi:hypothetical protein
MVVAIARHPVIPSLRLQQSVSSRPTGAIRDHTGGTDYHGRMVRGCGGEVQSRVGLEAHVSAM